jgi:hypothetical protein
MAEHTAENGLLTCEDFPGPESCCDSCHEDADEGYIELSWGDTDDGREYVVCCARLRNMEREPTDLT